MFSLFSFFKKLFKCKGTLYVSFPRGLEVTSTSPFFIGNLIDSNFTSSVKKDDNRLDVRPIDVLHELEQPVDIPEEDLTELEKKLENRRNSLNDSGFGSDHELERAVAICKARKKYPKFAYKFRWKTTVKSKVDALLKKYKLRLGALTDYIKSIPDEALDIMAQFTSLYDKVVQNSYPEFVIIAPADHFKKDPILLARSPFGEFYYVLYAWDKEIEYVADLLSEEKLVVNKQQ